MIVIDDFYGKMTHSYYFLHANDFLTKILQTGHSENKKQDYRGNRIQSGFRDLAMWCKISGFVFQSGFHDTADFFKQNKQ